MALGSWFPNIGGDTFKRKGFGSIAAAGAKGAAVGATKDPYNKKKPVQKAAQKRVVKAAARPQAVAPPPPPPKTSKQLLDEYRAANGGALPPGMSPELASLIDAGVDLEALKLSNPAAVNSINAIQAQLLGLPANYDASRAKISGDYANLTGDVETAGADWMKALYGNVVDPNDPNAAAFAADPAFAQYANTLGRIEETGDINEATDLAWFTKNQQAQQAYLQSLMTGVAGGTIPVGAALEGGGGSGGGGGGGGGRRGGGGYSSGGGSGGDWGDPKTTLTATDQLQDVMAEDVNQYNPDLYAGLMEAAGGDPELEAAFDDIFARYGEQPVPLQKGFLLEQEAAEEKLAELAQQKINNENYRASVGTRPAQTIQDWRTNMGMVQDPEHPGRWATPEGVGIAPQTAEQGRTNQAGARIQALTGELDVSRLQKLIAEYQAAKLAPHGNLKPGTLKSAGKEYGKVAKTKWADIIREQMAFDKESLAQAQRAHAAEPGSEPFPMGTWSGFTPRVDPQEIEDQEWYAAMTRAGRAALHGLDPNRSAQTTKISGKTTSTQTDKAATTQSQKGEGAPTVGGNINFPNPIAGAGGFLSGLSPTPRNNLQATTYVDPDSGDTIDVATGMPIDPITGVVSDSVTIGGGPTGRGFQIPKEEYTKQQNLASAARNRMAKSRGAIGKAAITGGLGSFGKKISTPKLKPPVKKEVAEAKTPSTAPSGKGNVRTRQLADGKATPKSKVSTAPTPVPPKGREVGLSKEQWEKKFGGKTKARVAAEKKYKKKSVSRLRAV